MERLHYNIEIKAPKSLVYKKMIGRETYKQWTSEFNPTSDFEGSWEKGEKIKFTGISQEGKKEGMVAQIEENIQNEFISIRHCGILDGDEEITSGKMVEAWAPAYENYTFAQETDITRVTVEVDVNEEYKDFFDHAWPKALHKLKEISEK